MDELPPGAALVVDGKTSRRRFRGSAAGTAAVPAAHLRVVAEPTVAPVGRNVLAYVPDGRAGAVTLEAARRLAETSGGWLTVAVPLEQPNWETMCRAMGGVAAHPAHLEALAQLRLQDCLDTLPSHVRTHGVILRGPLVPALLGRAESASHDVIVLPASRRHRLLRSRLRGRSAVPVLIPSRRRR
jgi:hypothetical protein